MTKTKTTRRRRASTDAAMEPYRPPVWDPEITRPGSQQFLQCPSRRGDRLYYRCGRVTDVEAER